MKIVLIILAVISSIIVLFLIIALFIKKDYSVEREIIINKSKQEVFDFIKFLKNQDKYSKWATMDPNMKQEFKGTDGVVGFVSAWESDKKDVGKGEQKITKIIEGERVETEIHFIKPMEGIANVYMTTESNSISNQTKVKWGFNSRMNYPMNIMLLFMDMEDMIGKDFSIGLTNLKNILEK